MQGTLNEIDLRSILQLIELGQRTGELLVEAYRTPSLDHLQGDKTFGQNSVTPIATGSSGEFWLIFFVNGQIVYTVDGNSHQGSRLRDYLYRYKLEMPLNKLGNSTLETNNDLEYAYLWELIEGNLLTPDQGRNLVHSMVHETLFDLLSLSQGAFIFEMGMALDPLLTNLEISPLVTQIMKGVRQWKQLHPHIQSPNQYLVITDEVKLKKALPEKAYEQLSGWAKRKTSLRQISRYLQRDLVPLAKAIYPYVERGWIHLGENSDDRPLGSTSIWEWNQTRQPPHILCIDDDLTIGKKVESILDHNNYRSSIISDPLQALSQVFQLKPDVILCDLAMPKLDGYEICTMLRHSSTFRHTPIIMLTGKEGFTDRIRARMVGSTDYLTKPFGEQELLLLLEKYGRP